MFDTNFKILRKKLQFIKKECQANLIKQFQKLHGETKTLTNFYLNYVHLFK